MDACHLLLGRPWQYDREVVHHGKENKYSFKKNGVTYKIQSLIEEDVVEKVESNALLMSSKEFLKNINKKEGVGYEILVKPREEEVPK